MCGVVSQGSLDHMTSISDNCDNNLPGEPHKRKITEGGCFTLLSRPRVSSNIGKKKDLPGVENYEIVLYLGQG